MNTIKGFIAEWNGFVFYTDGTDVFRASPSSAVDTRTGYLIGRWECTLAHFKRFAKAVYGIDMQ